jgi:isoamylase
MKKLILDSLRYYVEEMHVDGFRFDLAPILGEKDKDYNTWDDPAKTVLQEIVDDTTLNRYSTRVVAEPWSLAHFKLGGFPLSSKAKERGWYEWNGNFRDAWRSFLNSDSEALNTVVGAVDIGGAMTGSSKLFSWNKRRPYHSVNFLTVHDGFTLYDLFSYDKKRNACGVLNPTCCTSRLSSFCDVDSGENNNRSKDWGSSGEDVKRQQMRNAFVAMMISHGTPLILGGDEWMRTQLGNNNAYSSGADNSWNWFDWGTWKPNAARNRMHDFVRQLVKMRKAHAYAFAPKDYGAGASFSWKTAGNADMATSDWAGRHVMQHYYDSKAGKQLAILMNMDSSNVTFTLPTGTTWKRLLDTQSYYDEDSYFTTSGKDSKKSANITLDKPETVPGTTYTAYPRSIVVLEEAS